MQPLVGPAKWLQFCAAISVRIRIRSAALRVLSWGLREDFMIGPTVYVCPPATQATFRGTVICFYENEKLRSGANVRVDGELFAVSGLMLTLVYGVNGWVLKCALVNHCS